MTENLLQKLEEKVMMFLSEIETLRGQIQQLNRDNATLKAERDNQRIEGLKREDELKDRLEGLVSLLDSVNTAEAAAHNGNITAIKPVLIQETAQA